MNKATADDGSIVLYYSTCVIKYLNVTDVKSMPRKIFMCSGYTVLYVKANFNLRILWKRSLSLARPARLTKQWKNELPGSFARTNKKHLQLNSFSFSFRGLKHLQSSHI